MKFFNILKEYNNAIIKENKRLNSIYKSLLRECGDDLADISDTEAIDDCDVLEKDDEANLKNCDDDDSSCNEADFDEMLEVSRKDNSSKDTDNDLLVASEFFRECGDEDAATNEVEDLNDSRTAENDEVAKFFAEDDEDNEENEEVDSQKKKSSDEELMSAEEFFAEDDEDDKDDKDDKDDDLKENTDSKKGSSDDDLMTAEEFFDTTNETEDDETNEDSLMSKDKVINGSSKTDKINKKDNKCDETEKKLISAMDIFKSSPANEAEEDQEDDDAVKTEPKKEPAKEEPVKKEPAKEETAKDQSDEEDDTLKESLREYRRNNAHLFID